MIGGEQLRIRKSVTVPAAKFSEPVQTPGDRISMDDPWLDSDDFMIYSGQKLVKSVEEHRAATGETQEVKDRPNGDMFPIDGVVREGVDRSVASVTEGEHETVYSRQFGSGYVGPISAMGETRVVHNTDNGTITIMSLGR